MKEKRTQLVALLLIFGSLLVEVGDYMGWMAFDNREIPFGISLGLILFSSSLNVRVIRTMGIARRVKNISVGTLAFSIVYAILIFGFEVI